MPKPKLVESRQRKRRWEAASLCAAHRPRLEIFSSRKTLRRLAARFPNRHWKIGWNCSTPFSVSSHAAVITGRRGKTSAFKSGAISPEADFNACAAWSYSTMPEILITTTGSLPTTHPPASSPVESRKLSPGPNFRLVALRPSKRPYDANVIWQVRCFASFGLHQFLERC